MRQVLLENMTHIMAYNMAHIYDLYAMNLVEQNIDKHFLRNFAVKSTCLALTYR